MKRHRTLLALIAIELLICATLLVADDWPQWRGPKRDGISAETGLLHEWPADGPPQKWLIKDVGSGFSTPAVVGNRIYLLGNEGLDDEFVQARDTADGKKIWSSHIGKVGNPDQQPPYPGARSTPTVDGQVLYALGSDGDLVCLETSSGETRWHKNLRSDFAGQPGTWAYAESPLVDGDVLVCTPGGAEATVVALNKQTGDVIWKCVSPEADQAAYSSAIAAQIDGKKQYIQFLQKGVVGIDPADGQILWRYSKTAKGSPANIPTPLVAGDYIYTATGMAGSGLVNVKKTEGAYDAEQVYYTSKLPNSIGGTVKVGDYLYGTNSQALQCVEFKSGDSKWSDRSIAPASILFADGCLYLHGENGDLALVEATPDAYREKGKFTPPDQPDRGAAKAWAYPVVANGCLYIRDQDHLWCYDIKGK